MLLNIHIPSYFLKAELQMIQIFCIHLINFKHLCDSECPARFLTNLNGSFYWQKNSRFFSELRLVKNFALILLFGSYKALLKFLWPKLRGNLSCLEWLFYLKIKNRCKNDNASNLEDKVPKSVKSQKWESCFFLFFSFT